MIMLKDMRVLTSKGVGEYVVCVIIAYVGYWPSVRGSTKTSVMMRYHRYRKHDQCQGMHGGRRPMPVTAC